MRNLIPVDFVDLGVVEFVWFFLAFGGLSLVAPAGAWRRKTAIGFAVCALLFGGVRLATLEEGAGAWSRFGPVLFVPAFGAALVLLGAWRIPSLAQGLWGLALAVWSLAARPFAVASAWEWTFLFLVGLGLCGLLQAPRARRLLRWPLGLVYAAGLPLLCHLARPFAAGWLDGLAIVVLFGLTEAVVRQGPHLRKFVVRRLIGAPVVLVVLLALSFVMMRTAKGGPYDKEKAVDPVVQELLRARLRLDEPLHVQFGAYMGDLLWKGDLGISTKQKGQRVNEIIGRHAGPSLRLGLAATALALLIGVTSGLVSGMRQNSIFDYASMTGAMIGLALPTFVVGPMLVLVFAMKLDWFNVSGWEDFPRDLILPAITLSLPFAARVARLTRAGMLEIVNQDYIRTARAKGLSEPVIVIRHTLKGTLLPVVSFLGPAVAQLLTGSLVVEMIFNVPGLGTEFVQSALNRDYFLAMGLVVLFGTLLIVFNLIVDIVYGFLDPRIRHA